jgi:choline transport protein
VCSSAYAMPATVSTMNYNCVILVGVLFITAAWWIVYARKHYPGPKVMTMYIHDDKQVSQAPLQEVLEGQHESTEKKEA